MRCQLSPRNPDSHFLDPGSCKKLFQSCRNSDFKFLTFPIFDWWKDFWCCCWCSEIPQNFWSCRICHPSAAENFLIMLGLLGQLWLAEPVRGNPAIHWRHFWPQNFLMIQPFSKPNPVESCCQKPSQQTPGGTFRRGASVHHSSLRSSFCICSFTLSLSSSFTDSLEVRQFNRHSFDRSLLTFRFTYSHTTRLLQGVRRLRCASNVHYTPTFHVGLPSDFVTLRLRLRPPHVFPEHRRCEVFTGSEATIVRSFDRRGGTKWHLERWAPPPLLKVLLLPNLSSHIDAPHQCWGQKGKGQWWWDSHSAGSCTAAQAKWGPIIKKFFDDAAAPRSCVIQLGRIAGDLRDSIIGQLQLDCKPNILGFSKSFLIIQNLPI